MTDELTEQIYEAAKRKAINPHTGETLSFDQIIKRNCQEKIDREAERQLGGDRLEAGLPIGCPIPPEMVRGSFKHWADGWGIWLMDGTLFDEQVDEAKSAAPSNYQPRKIGWYVHYDVEGEGTDSKVKATFDPTLDGAWNAYVAHTARPNKNWALDYAMSVRDKAISVATERKAKLALELANLSLPRGSRVEAIQLQAETYMGRPTEYIESKLSGACWSAKACALCDGSGSMNLHVPGRSSGVRGLKLYPCPRCNPTPEWNVDEIEGPWVDVPIGLVWSEEINDRHMDTTPVGTWWLYRGCLSVVRGVTEPRTYKADSDGHTTVRWVTLGRPTDRELQAKATERDLQGEVSTKVYCDKRAQWVPWDEWGRSTSLVRWTAAKVWPVAWRAAAAALVAGLGWLVGGFLW